MPQIFMAAKRQTSYCESWEKEFPFLRGIPTDKYRGLCVACNKTFRIDGSGISQVRSHMSGHTHLEHEKRMKNQVTFYRSDNGSAVTSKNKFVLLPYEQIVKAEVLQAFKTVESNFSFAAATGDGDRFRQMFPDSKIAQGYKQNETKMAYVIKYGLSPYFRESLKSDFHAKAFCFKFDETTTSQVKKQYDGFVQYWSKSQNGIVVAYCGSLFVDHCPAEKLVEHFFTFIKKSGLDVKFMLHLGMDGPNVNLKFQRLLLQSSLLVEAQTSFLDIGSCPLHIVHNAFRKGVSQLKFNVDQFALDIHFFFKLSAARRADYKSMVEFTDIVSEYALKHSTTRWVTMRKVVVRLIEQYDNLKEYFLTFLPTTSSFKASVKNSSRYENICKMLKDVTTLSFLSFVAYFATDFESFLTKFQSMKPLIHTLYEEMGTLLWNIMAKFVKSKHLTEMKDGEKHALSVSKLLLVNTCHKDVVKGLRHVDIGTKASGLFLSSSLSIGEVEKNFRSDCLQAYRNAADYLKRMLPINSFIENAAFINPEKRNGNGSLEGITKLTKMVLSALPNVFPAIFPACLTTEDVCDIVRTEWRLYQTEKFPDSAYQTSFENKMSLKKQNSYWEEAFMLAGVDSVTKESPKCDMVKFVLHLEKLVGSDGKPKYAFLVSLFQVILSISHGNSAPENGFSINKAMLDAHGNSLGESTIEALRFVKDAILRYPSILDIPVTRSLIDNVKDARTRYMADLESTRKIEQEEAARKRELDAQKKVEYEKSEELSVVRVSLQQLQNGLAVADDSVKEGNDQLKELLSQKNCTKHQLQRAQSKIEMGLKRRAELEADKEVLQKRLREIDQKSE